MKAVIDTLTYIVIACAFLVVFMHAYVRFTPYNEFKEIANNNVAAAIAFCGAIVGFTLPLLASIYFTHSLLEMLKWAAITGCVQLVVFTTLRKNAGDIEHGHIAPALFVATLSVVVGAINGACISY
jgi:putative membrane protein